MNQQNAHEKEEAEKELDHHGAEEKQGIAQDEKEKQEDHVPLSIEEIEDHLNSGGKVNLNGPLYRVRSDYEHRERGHVSINELLEEMFRKYECMTREAQDLFVEGVENAFGYNVMIRNSDGKDGVWMKFVCKRSRFIFSLFSLYFFVITSQGELLIPVNTRCLRAKQKEHGV
jgi:hypothetical protein